jgi:hypothetical protein
MHTVQKVTILLGKVTLKNRLLLTEKGDVCICLEDNSADSLVDTMADNMVGITAGTTVGITAGTTAGTTVGITADTEAMALHFSEAY